MKKQIRFILLQVLIIITVSVQYAYALNPEKEHKYFPSQFGLNKYKIINVETTDHYKINCWFFSPETVSNHKTIIIVNGDAGNMSYSLFYVKQLIDKGYDVITFDYRGFGKSSNFKINNDFLYYYEFSYDLKAVVRYAKENIMKNKKIGIMAFSMGTLITTLSYPNIKNNIDFMIAENYVINPYLIQDRIKKLKNKDIILPRNISEKLYQERLESIDTPTLIFSSIKDNVTTLQDAKDINKKINCTLVSYNGKHGQGLYALTNKYIGDIYFNHINLFITALNNE